jgi:FMN-dependent oxidoreductase (nitrilotriacetate monooxygenase family)
MTKEIRLNAFDMNCVAHQSSGMWTHPRDRSWTYKDLDYWVDLARLLERGRFDGIFIADVLGVYDVYEGSADVALRNATQVPVNDPFLLIPAMAHVTEHLGFGVTGTLSYEAPFQFARRMSTLDHLTKGRAGWNIVTGYLESAAKGAGLDKQTGHDLRYDIADEYMQVVYKLWEGSWDDDAVVRDRERGVFTQAEKVRKIHHKGDYYIVDAIHLCEPSPQRTPVLYQAGTSGKGRDFAARHAECVFMAAPSKQIVTRSVADIRRRAAAHGRGPAEILIFALITVIVAPTEAAAKSKHEEYRSYVNHEGALTLVSGWTGIDFSKYALDDVVRYIENDAIRSAVETLAVRGRARRRLRRSEWQALRDLDRLGVAANNVRRCRRARPRWIRRWFAFAYRNDCLQARIRTWNATREAFWPRPRQIAGESPRPSLSSDCLLRSRSWQSRPHLAVVVPGRRTGRRLQSFQA